MTKSKLAGGTAVIAFCICYVAPARALTIAPQTSSTSEPQTSPAAKPSGAQADSGLTSSEPTSGSAPGAPQGEDIIVTGSARPQRRFDVSYAINSLSNDEIQRRAPINFADLLGQEPGIQVEPTGGEVQNITRVRGIPTDDGYAIFQQDGLVLFHDLNGYFFRGDTLNRIDLMTQRVEIVRGGPAPIFTSQAAAVVNSITVTGTDTTHGKAQVTLGNTGLYRLDAYQAGPLGGDNYYAIGGFIRRHDGYRDNGFPNDRGGQIRANLKHDFSNGSVRLSVNYMNDHNVFYLPIPIADPRNPTVSLNQYINFFTGTLNSPALRNATLKFRDGAGVLQSETRDLANGRHIEYGNVGLQYDGDFDGWLVSVKGGYTKGSLDFDALYSTTNPADATAFAAGFLGAANTAFGSAANPVARLGYAIAGTNSTAVYNPASASGLVAQAQYRAITSTFYSGQADLSLTHKFETGFGSHDVKIGLYGSAYGNSQQSDYQDYLIEVAGKPRTLDLVAYSASGAVLGYVTDKGVLRYSTTLNQGKVDATVLSLYGNDTWDITSNLRLDAGIRHEWYSFNGFGLLSATANLGDPTTLADDATRAFTGAIQTHVLKPQVTNWTVGVNYDVASRFGGYLRASHLEQPPAATAAFGINPVIVTTKADQYEAGLKTTIGRSYLYLTGFYTRFDPFNASFVAFNPQTGRNDQAVPFVGKVQVLGVESDAALRVVPWFSLDGSFTYQNPQYKNFTNTSGADPALVNGNQIIREPKVFGNVRPTFRFIGAAGEVEIYGRYEYTGKRYVDFFNSTALPAFGQFSAGATLIRGTFQFQVVGDNITDAHGLTEGNTRTDQFGQGTRNAIYGRPIFGRNFRFVLSKSW